MVSKCFLPNSNRRTHFHKEHVHLQELLARFATELLLDAVVHLVGELALAIVLRHFFAQLVQVVGNQGVPIRLKSPDDLLGEIGDGNMLPGSVLKFVSRPSR